MRLVALALLLVACSAQPASQSSPASSPSGSAASPITNPPSPSPWSCRLPVIEGSPGQTGGPQTAGFLSLPGSSPSFTPAADAGDGMFYDRSLARWVPAGPPALSDDGLSYAYTDGVNNSSRVHLVDLTTKRDNLLVDGGAWRLVGLRPDAVYMMRIEFLPESPAYGVIVAGRGLWKVPVGGGAPVPLTSDDREWVVAGGAAWGGGSTVNVAGGPNDIVRLDLQTNQLTTWFAPGQRSHVLAIEAGGVPLIMSEASDEELWRVPAPGGEVKIWSGPTDGPRPYYPVAVDGDVVWFSSANFTRSWSIFRYSASRGLEVVANFTDHPVTVAGPCA